MFKRIWNKLFGRPELLLKERCFYCFEELILKPGVAVGVMNEWYCNSVCKEEMSKENECCFWRCAKRNKEYEKARTQEYQQRK